MKKNMLSLLMVLVLSLFMAACNSSENTSDGNNTNSQEETNDAAQTETNSAEKSSEESIKTIEEGKLQYALSGMAKPYNYVDADNKLVGFDVDIANEVANRLGLEPVAVQTPWASILQGLKAGKYDAIIGGMSITPEREEQVDFSDPYFISQAVMFINEENPANIKSKEDLKGKVVGVVTASTYKDFALELVGEDGEVREYSTDLFALQELKNAGRVDVVITDLGIGQHAIQQSNLPLKAVGEPLFADKVGIPVQQGNTALLDEINKALAAMIEDGTYLEISKKWFDRDMLSTTN